MGESAELDDQDCRGAKLRITTANELRAIKENFRNCRLFTEGSPNGSVSRAQDYRDDAASRDARDLSGEMCVQLPVEEVTESSSATHWARVRERRSGRIRFPR